MLLDSQKCCFKILECQIETVMLDTVFRKSNNLLDNFLLSKH